MLDCWGCCGGGAGCCGGWGVYSCGEPECDIVSEVGGSGGGGGGSGGGRFCCTKGVSASTK